MTFLEFDAAAAPPLRNGELDFEAPWQGRVFMLASALSERGVFVWPEFQSALIHELKEVKVSPDQPYAYYEHFLRALANLLEARGIVGHGELEQLVDHFAERELGHDHHPHVHAQVHRG